MNIIIMIQVGRHCPALEQLDVHGCRQVKILTVIFIIIGIVIVITAIIIVIIVITTRMKSNHQMSLYKVTNVGVTELLARCPNVTNLNLAGFKISLMMT